MDEVAPFENKVRRGFDYRRSEAALWVQCPDDMPEESLTAEQLQNGCHSDREVANHLLC